MTIVFYLNWLILAAALLLALYALYRGPGILNRTVALDLLTAVTVGIVALSTVMWLRRDTMQILIVLTLVSFLTATSVARIVSQQQAARQVGSAWPPEKQSPTESDSDDSSAGGSDV